MQKENCINLKPYYQTEHTTLYLGDCFEVLKQLPKESVDMIFADPPYFLSNDGFTCKSGKMVSVNKGNWDRIDSVEDKHEFNRQWIRLCKEILHSKRHYLDQWNLA